MIELTREGALACIALRRAEKKNALTSAMWQQLLSLFSSLAQDTARAEADAPRVLILQGSGGAFCAGADIEEMSRLVRDPTALAANNALVSQAQQALAALPMPTLAVIDGPCFGGGFGLAAACDFRLASSRSFFAVTPARLGLLYSLEDTRRLLSLLGLAHTRRLLLRSERLDAATALAWGAVDAVVDSEALPAAAQAWAAGLAAQSPTSMAGIKASLAFLGDSGAHSEAPLRAAFDAAFTGADFKEGAAAFLQRREPKF